MADPVEPAQAVGTLMLWTGVIVLALLATRRWLQRGRAVLGPTGLRVVARAALTRGSCAVVVETDGRRFLLGAAEQGVTLLSELEPSPSTAPGAETAGAGATAPWHSSAGLPPGLALAVQPATERRASTPDRPRIGLLDRARALTVRTYADRPFRAARP